MVPVAASMSLAQFQSAIAPLDVRRRLCPPKYARRKRLTHAGSHCPLCSIVYDPTTSNGPNFPSLASLVHTSLGGPLTVDNLFVCCRRCQQLRASTDLLTVPNLPADLAAQRHAVLLLAQNHLAPLPPSTTLAAYRSALAQRHTLPRSRVYAAQADDGSCYVGVSSRYGDTQSKGLARLLAQVAGTPLDKSPRLTVYRLEDDAFRRVVWQLIEANAWVVGVGRRSGLRDFQDYWWLTSASVGELRLRKIAGVQVPLNASRREVGPRAMRQRKLVAERRAKAQAKADLLFLKQAEVDFDQAMGRLRDQQAMGLPGELEETRYYVNRYWAAYSKVHGQAAMPSLNQ